MAQTSRACPLALLGYNYVIEGSMNGNRFIARALSRTLPRTTLSYLDPYGEEQAALWRAYRERMDALAFDSEQSDGMVEAARDMFRFVSEIGDELVAERERAGG